MKVVVRFTGRQGQRFPLHDRQKAMPVEIPDGARVKDLIDHLKMPGSQNWMVVLEGRILNPDSILTHNACLFVVPAAFGG